MTCISPLLVELTSGYESLGYHGSFGIKTLTDLLKFVGPIVKVDQNTLLRLKDKFARVCLNINTTQPLPASLPIVRGGLSMRVSVIYEGLLELCPLCGRDSHQLDSCPKLPSQKRIKVVVRKFDEADGSPQTEVLSSSSNARPAPNDNWVSVPKEKSQTSSWPSP